MRRRLFCVLLTFCLLTNIIVGLTAAAVSAQTTGTSGTTVIGYLYNNDVVTILDTVTLNNGDRWYKINKGSLTGYTSAAYIAINPTYQTEAQFEAYLTAQGFPESYKPMLRAIHAQYPNWVFEARHLSMSWATALAAESRVGLNTITSPDAWKSMEYGAYNWSTDNYVEYDSGGWVAASPRLVAYYLDPRNFLDSTYIFQFERLTFSTEHTLAGIRAILPDALDTHAEALLQAAEATNVSAYHLAARMRQEGSHTNGLGTGTVEGYEGYYNFFHFGAYKTTDKDGNEISAVTNGAIYAKNKGWDTPYKCIRDSADNLARGYIRLGQDTTYFQKFNMTNTTSGLYSHQYMTNTAAAASEGRIRRNSATDSELQNAIVFSIPVYKNMPETIAPQPSKTGNNNNFLDSLSVGGATLTPSFDRYHSEYSLHVGAVDSITVSANRSDSDATVSGDGTVALAPGTNIIPITVTATSGEKRTYTLTVTCDGIPEPPAGTTPEITGTTYAVGETVTKVEPNTAVSIFIQNLAVKNGEAKLYAANGQAKTSGIVATGDIVRLYSGTTETASYPVVIYGDVNGDGKVAPADMLRIQKHLVSLITLEGYQLQAADINKNGSIQPADVLRGQKYIVSILTSIQ